MKKVLVVMLIAVALLWSCATENTVVIEPGESAELIIVEPKKETPKVRWDWRSREKVRKDKKNDSEECCPECCVKKTEKKEFKKLVGKKYKPRSEVDLDEHLGKNK